VIAAPSYRARQQISAASTGIEELVGCAGLQVRKKCASGEAIAYFLSGKVKGTFMS
jgi:hypothetical protein